jgi:histidinol-phosphate aminotransferase
LVQTVANVAAAREQLYQIALDNDIQSIPSATNFVALDCGRDGEHASKVLQHLIGSGIFVRMPGVSPLNRCIRVSVGAQKDLDQFSEALKGALKAVSG